MTEWVESQDDRTLNAWLLYAGSRLDMRKQDLYRARDRAQDAIKLYSALDAKPRIAEIHNHLARIELQDGNLETCLEHVDQALSSATVEQEDRKGIIPGVLAQAELLKGQVARRRNDLEKATEHFSRSNNVASQIGVAALALDAGLGLGEALLASRQVDKAADVLGKVMAGTRQVRNPVRERQACELLAQAEGVRKNYDKAVALATRTLELSKNLRFEQALPVDLYNVGFFHFANKKPTEAITYFRQASERLGEVGRHPIRKELMYFMGVAQAQTGSTDEARTSLTAALELAQQAKDVVKTVSSLDHLGAIEMKDGNKDKAREHLTNAIALAKQADLKEQRRQLRKKLDSL